MPEQLDEYVPSEENEAIWDIDGTLTRDFALLGLICSQADEGLIAKDASVLDLVAEIENGFIEPYEKTLTTLLHRHARALRGQPEEAVQAHAEEFYDNPELWLPFAKPTIDGMRERKFGNTIVSGGPHFGVEAAARFLGVRRSFSTHYSTAENDAGESVFTGKLDWDLAASGKKGALVLALRRKLHKENPDGITIYHGDSDGDIFALHAANGAFVVRPSDKLLQRSRQCGWPIIPEDELLNAAIAPTLLNGLEKLQKRRLLVVNPPVPRSGSRRLLAYTGSQGTDSAS
jgi:phosphoserine phosphatase